MKTKKAEVFGMSFSMIFSILLIVFFIVVAFIGFRSFFKWQKNSQIAMFVDDIEFRVDEVWKSDLGASINFNSVLPSEIKYVCFMNLRNDSFGANAKEEEIFNEMKSKLAIRKIKVEDNIYFYYTGVELELNSKASKELKYINLQTKNPICVKIINNKFSIKLEKNTYSPLVNIIV